MRRVAIEISRDLSRPCFFVISTPRPSELIVLTPLSPTFWVSSLEGADTNTGDTTMKCTLGEATGTIAWLSESHAPGTNCVGNPMVRDTIVRTFDNPKFPLAVEDWEDY